MSDQEKLVCYLKDGKTCNEICELLNITNKQLYNRLTNLKNKGFLYKRKYFSNGILMYIPISKINDVSNFKNKKSDIIFTSNMENNVKCLAISDLHFGNSLSRLDLINKAFDYCVKENIHIILLCGDLIDGTFSQNKQSITSISKQIDFFIKNYPFDKRILTFGVGGDHDLNGLYKGCQDIIETILNYRHDIAINRYGSYYINIKNDQLLLYHHTSNGILFPEEASVILHGHSHKYSLDTSNNIFNILVPSLSEIGDTIPTALEINFQFKNGFIHFVNIKQLLFQDRTIVLNEITKELPKGKDSVPNPVKYTEKIKEEKLLTKSL